jgi:ABC-type dipeptide/oligopeptide/nickel transport system ATPase component
MQSNLKDKELFNYIKKYTVNLDGLLIPRIPTTFLNMDAGRPILAIGESGSGKTHMSLSLIRHIHDISSVLYVSESGMDEGKNSLVTENLPEMFLINTVDELLTPQISLNSQSIFSTFHDYCESTITAYKVFNKELKIEEFIKNIILNKKSLINNITDEEFYIFYKNCLNGKKFKGKELKEFLKSVLSIFLSKTQYPIENLFTSEDLKFVLVLLSSKPKFLIFFDDVSEKLTTLKTNDRTLFKKALTQSRGHYTTILCLHDISVLAPDERTGSAMIFMDRKSIETCSNKSVEMEIKEKSKFIGKYFDKSSSDPFIKYSYLVYLPELSAEYQEILKQAGIISRSSFEVPKWFSICCDGEEALYPKKNFKHFTNVGLNVFLRNYVDLKNESQMKIRQEEEEKKLADMMNLTDKNAIETDEFDF